MLCQLDVRNYALIDSMSVSFAGGLNVLTGETGAGKSLVIDCVGLAIGGRASADMVRTGADSAVVDALFDISDVAEAAAVLTEMGIEPEPDGTLVLSRQVWKQGRSQCRVNGRVVTATALSQLGSMLVDIYGQHDYQSLTRPSRHIALLDSFGGPNHLALLSEYRSIWSKWLAVRADLAQLRARAREMEQRVDVLSYQVNEISSASLTLGEDESLTQERQVISNAERLHDAARRAYEGLYGGEGDERPSAYDLLAAAASELEGASKIDPSLAAQFAAVSEACLQVGAVAKALRAYADATEFDPERLSTIEERLSVIARLKRKYGDTIADVIGYLERASKELQLLTGAEERSHELEAAEEKLGADLARRARELSALRAREAERLGDAVCEQLKGLNMPRARFAVELTPIQSEHVVWCDGVSIALGPLGCDEVEFMFSANAGEEPRPLARIASGGELSRVMLAIKSVLALADEMPTMVFDEVDQGIGGEAALAVAVRLKHIGAVRQVLAVTHLPQIAAASGRHLVVEKEESEGRTGVSVRALSGEERVRELARMLAGDNPSPVTVRHATEMLRQGQETEGWR